MHAGDSGIESCEVVKPMSGWRSRPISVFGRGRKNGIKGFPLEDRFLLLTRCGFHRRRSTHPETMAVGEKYYTAKITRPVPRGTFPRKRLFRLLDEARDLPVTWVSGPPGSGKTTLVSGYLEGRKAPCLWYRIDERDSDPATFFHYPGLAARVALRVVAEGLDSARRLGASQWDHLFHAAGAYATLLAGSGKAAGECLGKLKATLPPSRRFAECQYEYLCAWLHLLLGDHAAAADHAGRALAVAEAAGGARPKPPTSGAERCCAPPWAPTPPRKPWRSSRPSGNPLSPHRPKNPPSPSADLLLR